MTDPRPYPIGFLGRLDPVKRIPDLLQAVQQLNGLVHLHIFGQGGDRPRIESIISRLGIEPHVTLHGAVLHPRTALQQVGLLVLPSQAEGFGMVLIEAMAWMVPVVATDAPGIRDVVRHNQDGLLIPVADPPALAAAIRSVVDSRALRERLVECAWARVAREYDWNAVADQYRLLLRLPTPAQIFR
jgi:glycosyltransferase involved in cell wall biosynthesis